MRFFTCEQVSKYHPDKYADQISDAILTECLQNDKNSHCGIETLVKNNTVVLSGEITSNAKIDYAKIVNRVAKKLNYKVDDIINLISNQSQEINRAVLNNKKIGAGDQGMMFGYACNESESFLPFGFDLANKIIKKIEDDVKNNILLGDAKCQVTVDLDTNEIIKVLISVCHVSTYSLEDIREYIATLIDFVPSEKLIINPAGLWTVGGPTADCGLTGRKIVCDQYGGYCAVGGGAFSGKDPTKVDRSAAYMARKIAIDLLNIYKVKKVEIQLAYMIGVPEPMSINCKFNDEKTDEYVEKWISKNYDLTPSGIIKKMDLYNRNYEEISEGCHYRLKGGI